MTYLKQGAALSAVFVLSFLLFMVVLMPASIVTAYWPTDNDSPPPPRLYGVWWQGQGLFDLEGLPLKLGWELDWHGLTPGLLLSVRSGDIRATGWVGADWGDWRLENWRASLPAETVNPFLPQGKASGTVAIALQELLYRDSVIAQIQGELHFDGGQVALSEGLNLDVPALLGTLTMEHNQPVLRVTGPQQQSLASATLNGNTLSLDVFRAFPLLLKMSEGGNATDVVFSTHQQLPVSAAQSG